MAYHCTQCDSKKLLNLETARTLGITAGALAGTLKGAYMSLYARDRLALHILGRFPLNRISAIAIASATEGIAGAITAYQLFQYLMPNGEGTPWLCLSCSHAFRQPMD